VVKAVKDVMLGKGRIFDLDNMQRELSWPSIWPGSDF
jgi:hypothetical protein